MALCERMDRIRITGVDACDTKCYRKQRLGGTSFCPVFTKELENRQDACSTVKN